MGEDDRGPLQIIKVVHPGIQSSAMDFFCLEPNRVTADGVGNGGYHVKDRKFWRNGKGTECWEYGPVYLR